MRLRLLISVVATMGVLLHAGFLVRHCLVMADATQAYHALMADLSSLCRASAGERGVRVSELPSLPHPSDPQGCPVCAGLVGAFAVFAQQALPIQIAAAASTRPPSASAVMPRTVRTAHPPARGSPALG
jgi:hypothetical protein